MQTSEEAYSEYQRLRRMEERQRNVNGGNNLLKSNGQKRYSVDVRLVVTANLIERSEELQVNTNLPIEKRYWGTMKPDEFLNNLAQWVDMPRYTIFLEWNRRRENKIDSWSMPKFRTTTINFSQIDFSIGSEAEKKLQKNFVKKQWEDWLEGQIFDEE